MLDIIKSSGFYLNNKYQTREAHKIILKDEMRTNTYNATTGVITISQNRALAIAETQRHYIDLYTSNKQEYQQLREDYAFPIKMILDKEKARKLSAFFFWSAWAASTNRPEDEVTYTSNWPHEPLIGNTPPPSVLLWSIISIFLLLAVLVLLFGIMLLNLTNGVKTQNLSRVLPQLILLKITK
ncbi:Nitric-oxide reductase (EC, quinol-dependent [uncultured Gammaproteobacteria bacterium]|nr:Nitric-oxide reductase (EC, quinol-dependent [uncultured Gammaproteobacteria bacterium]